MKKITGYFIVFCLLQSIFLYGQEKKQHYIFMDNGFAFQTVQDYGMSPLLYSGLGFMTQAGYYFYGEKYIHQVTGNFSAGFLSTRNYEDDEAIATFLDGGAYYTVLRHIKDIGATNDYRLFAGGSFDFRTGNRINTKLGNSAYNYEIFSGLALSGRIEKLWHRPARERKIWFVTFDLKERDIIFDYQVNIPLISWGVRPSFVTISDGMYSTVELGNSGFYTFDVLKRFYSRLGASYIFNNGNMFKLSITKNMYAYKKDFNNVSLITNALLASFIFNLN